MELRQLGPKEEKQVHRRRIHKSHHKTQALVLQVAKFEMAFKSAENVILELCSRYELPRHDVLHLT
eukprot:766564-Hanusia_phi.AAC.2